jgi:hypothetical protein
MPEQSVKNCKKTNIAVAIYYSNDMIHFVEYEDSSKNKYLQIVTFENDVIETQALISLKSVPQEILEIYAYTSQTSHIEFKNNAYNLIGNHIGRSKKYNFKFTSYDNHPINDDEQNIYVSPIPDVMLENCKSIHKTMIKVKGL